MGIGCGLLWQVNGQGQGHFMTELKLIQQTDVYRKGQAVSWLSYINRKIKLIVTVGVGLKIEPTVIIIIIIVLITHSLIGLLILKS